MLIDFIDHKSDEGSAASVEAEAYPGVPSKSNGSTILYLSIDINLYLVFYSRSTPTYIQ